jgi:hypothetical protein
VAVQEAFLTETASRPMWFCRPLCGAMGQAPTPRPTGPAILRAAHFQSPHEEPNEECPLLTTGRTSITFTAGPRLAGPGR